MAIDKYYLFKKETLNNSTSEEYSPRLEDFIDPDTGYYQDNYRSENE